MGLFDSNKSSTNITETRENAFNNLDNKVIGDDSVVGGNTTLNLTESSTGAVNITNTDYGAVSAGIDLAGKSLDYGESVISSSLSVVRDINADALSNNSSLTNSAISAVKDSYEPAGQETINKMVLLAGVAVVSIFGFKYLGGKNG